jgi:hypothetical protein
MRHSAPVLDERLVTTLHVQAIRRAESDHAGHEPHGIELEGAHVDAAALERIEHRG